jgi:hypothetical protein
MTKDEALAFLKKSNCAGIDTVNGEIDIHMVYDGYISNGAKICAHVNLDGFFDARKLRALLALVEASDKEKGIIHES